MLLKARGDIYVDSYLLCQYERRGRKDNTLRELGLPVVQKREECFGSRQ
jgi:hypothetical protein